MQSYLNDILLLSAASTITSADRPGVMAPGSWPPALADSLPSDSAVRLVVLTLSAYRFQSLMCVLAVSETADTCLDTDHLKELANNLCGTVKRHLGRHVSVLGMSTPDLLPLDSLKYLHNSHQQVPIGVQCRDAQGIRYYVALLMQGDIRVDEVTTGFATPGASPVAVTEVTGELELF